MKKFKKIVFGIIIITIITIAVTIAICSNISLGAHSIYTKDQFHMFQAPRPTGSTYSLFGETALALYWNAYCIEEDVQFDWGKFTYDVRYKVEIRGDEATSYDSEGNLIGTTTDDMNAIFGAVLTPNSYLDYSLVEEYRPEETIGLFGTYDGAMDGDGFSMVQYGVWYLIQWWVDLNGLDIEWSGSGLPSGPGEDVERNYYDGSISISNETELNLDVYLISHDAQQDLLLVYPYGEDLPEDVPDKPVTPDPDTEVIDITVTKKWEDENNRDGKRPNEITVTLYANGKTYKEETFGGYGNVWTHQFKDVPKRNLDGNIIKYTIKETPIDNYQTTQESVYTSE